MQYLLSVYLYRPYFRLDYDISSSLPVHSILSPELSLSSSTASFLSFLVSSLLCYLESPYQITPTLQIPSPRLFGVFEVWSTLLVGDVAVLSRSFDHYHRDLFLGSSFLAKSVIPSLRMISFFVL